MNAPASRRGFLCGLTTLPLIGGGMTLIGRPTAVAARPSRELLLAYNEWLFMERRLLCKEAWPGIDAECFVPANTGALDFFIPPYPASWTELPQPSTRAALVLSAVGCDWPGGGR